MTYNVFSGTLNPTQSIKVKRDVKLQPTNSNQPTNRHSGGRQSEDSTLNVGHSMTLIQVTGKWIWSPRWEAPRVPGETFTLS